MKPGSGKKLLVGGGLLVAVIWVVVVLGRAIGVGRAEGTHGPPAGSIVWQTDYDRATEEGKKLGRPVLAVFSASWCPPCQGMKQSVWPDAEVGKVVSEKYVAVYLDVDVGANQPAAERFGINVIPTIVVVDGSGKEVKRGNTMDKGELVGFLK